MLRYRTIDDRGRPCRAHALFLGDLPSDPAAAGWLTWGRGAARAIRRLVFAPPLLRALAIALGVGTLVTLVAFHGPFALAVTLFSPVSSTLILVALTMALSLAASMSRHLARARRAILAQGRCASCLYRLTGIEPDAAHITTCPECGSGWDLRPEGPTQVVVVRASSISPAPPIPPTPTNPPPHQRRETTRPPTIVASTGLPPSSYASDRSSS